LCWAAHEGQLQEVQSLITQGVSVHVTDYHGHTPLHNAAEGGHTEVARLLLRCGARVDALDNKGRTPAMLAMAENHRTLVEYLVGEGANVTLQLGAYLGDAARVRELIDQGADANAKDPEGWMPLHYAVLGNQQETARLLLAAGADANAAAQDRGFELEHPGDAPLHLAVSEGHTDLVSLLIDSGADTEAHNRQSLTALCSAVYRGQLEMVKLLMAKGVDPNNASPDNYFCRGLPLGIAVEKGAFDIVEALIAGGANVNVGDASGWTPLHVAVTSYYSSAVEEALPMASPELGAPQDYWNRYRAAYDRIRDNLTVRMLGLLIAHGADVNSRDREKTTPLHCAAYHGLQGAVEFLIRKGADVNARTARDPTPDGIMWEWDRGFRMEPGVTPLHEAVAGWDPNVIDVLITHGAEVNIADESGRTAVHYGAARGFARVVGLLIARGADVNARDHTGATPLAIALHEGHMETAKCLIAAGARRIDLKTVPVKAHPYGELPPPPLLHRPLWMRSVPRAERSDPNDPEPDVVDYRREWVELLLANGADPNERDEKGNTALHAAMLAGDDFSARLLIDHGADIQARNGVNATPLHHAASNGRKDLVDLLLHKGAHVNARESDGDTPLHNAALRGHREIVQVLLTHGADGSVKNSRGRTPLDEAVRRGHREVIQVLKAHQATKPGLPGESEK
jgi:ankyrin repeat protein